MHILGPIVGLVTNHTARILFEVSSPGPYRFECSTWNETTARMVLDVPSTQPTVLHVKFLKPGTTYSYQISHQDDPMDGIYGVFTTLKTPFEFYTPHHTPVFEACEMPTSVPFLTFLSSYDQHARDDSFVSLFHRERTGYKFFLRCPLNMSQVQKIASRRLAKIPNESWHARKEDICILFRNVFRNEWKRILWTREMNRHPTIFGGDDGGNLPASIPQDRRQFIRTCLYEVFQQYCIALRFNPHGSSHEDFFAMRIGNVGILHLDVHRNHFVPVEGFLGKDQIQFFQDTVPRMKGIQKWILLGPDPIFLPTPGKPIFSQRHLAQKGFRTHPEELNCLFRILQGHLPMWISPHCHHEMDLLYHARDPRGSQILVGPVSTHGPCKISKKQKRTNDSTLHIKTKRLCRIDQPGMVTIRPLFSKNIHFVGTSFDVEM